MEMHPDRPFCCRCCDHFNDGEGGEKCLSCKDIEKLLPSMETSRKKHVYMPYPPEQVTFPDYGARIGMVDSISVLSTIQFAVLMKRQAGLSWGEIGKELNMNRQNVKRTYNRAIRRMCAEQEKA